MRGEPEHIERQVRNAQDGYRPVGDAVRWPDRGAREMPTAGERRQALDLAKPLSLRAEMARAGIAPTQNRPYDDPEHGWSDPLDTDEARTIVRRFMAALWRACERAEADAKVSPFGGER